MSPLCAYLACWMQCKLKVTLPVVSVQKPKRLSLSPYSHIWKYQYHHWHSMKMDTDTDNVGSKIFTKSSVTNASGGESIPKHADMSLWQWFRRKHHKVTLITERKLLWLEFLQRNCKKHNSINSNANWNKINLIFFSINSIIYMSEAVHSIDTVLKWDHNLGLCFI